MASSSLMPLGMLVFGPLSDRISIDILLIVTGTGIALLSIAFVGSKTLREAGKSHV
jgi:DHA3 family macrolide efflux protein-like MFS transporter